MTGDARPSSMRFAQGAASGGDAREAMTVGCKRTREARPLGPGCARRTYNGFNTSAYHARMARRAQHLRCSLVREANERTASWIIRVHGRTLTGPAPEMREH